MEDYNYQVTFNFAFTEQVRIDEHPNPFETYYIPVSTTVHLGRDFYSKKTLKERVNEAAQVAVLNFEDVGLDIELEDVDHIIVKDLHFKNEEYKLKPDTIYG